MEGNLSWLQSKEETVKARREESDVFEHLLHVSSSAWPPFCHILSFSPSIIFQELHERQRRSSQGAGGGAWGIEARHESKYQTNKCKRAAGTWLERRSIGVTEVL